MTKIRLSQDVYIPYCDDKDPALFDPTPLDGPNKGQGALTTEDLYNLVSSPSIADVVRLAGQPDENKSGIKNDIMDKLNATIVMASRGLAGGAMGQYRARFFAPDEIQISAGQNEVEEYVRLLESEDERERFAQYLSSAESIEPFVVGIFNKFADNTDGMPVEMGLYFNRIKKADNQAALLRQMDNIASAARMLVWAEATIADEDRASFSKRFMEWSVVSNDERLGYICAAKESTGLGMDKRFREEDRFEAAVNQDKILCLLVTYYQNGDLNAISAKLDDYRRSKLISGYRLGKPNKHGFLEDMEVSFADAEKESNKDPSSWRPYDNGRGVNYIDRVRVAEAIARRNAVDGSLEFRKLANKLRDDGDKIGAIWAYQKSYKLYKNLGDLLWIARLNRFSSVNHQQAYDVYKNVLDDLSEFEFHESYTRDPKYTLSVLREVTANLKELSLYIYEAEELMEKMRKLVVRYSHLSQQPQ